MFMLVGKDYLGPKRSINSDGQRQKKSPKTGLPLKWGRFFNLPEKLPIQSGFSMSPWLRISHHEIHRRPELFPLLRVLADRRPLPARFLILGSAAPDLLSQSSETLAGRLETVVLEGFRLADLGARAQGRLWMRGGFPLAYTARS